MKSLGPTLSCLSRELVLLLSGLNRELVLLLSGPIRELVLLLSGLNRELYCFTNKTLTQKTFKEQISTLQFTYKVIKKLIHLPQIITTKYNLIKTKCLNSNLIF